MNQNEIKEVLHLHKLWLNSDPKGQKANLMDADLRNANLRNADLRNAFLSDANLTDANLRNAFLSGANLTDADLRNAFLSDANLADANLEGANLEGANLEGANLMDANLMDANLRNANLMDAFLSGATFDKETKFSEGFDPVARGMILVEGKASPSPVVQEVVAAGTAATTSTLHEDLSEVLAKHGLTLGKNVTLNINFIG